MIKKLTVSKAKQKAWDVFSKYIRLSNSYKLSPGGERVCECYTCGARKEWKFMQAGHYIAGHRAINMFNEINVKPQCALCNIYKHGDPITYREHLVKDYGEDIVEELEAHRNDIKQWKVYELEELYKKYKAKLTEYEGTT